jgi:hypothetical protein
MSVPARLPHPIETVRLHRIGADFAFASVRLPGVMLNGLQVRVQPDGELRITPPSTPDKSGRMWPCFTLQPGVREAVEASIAVVWARSEDDGL